MKYLKMQPGEVMIERDPVFVQKSKWLRAPFSGIFQSLAKNGSHVKRRTVIGTISDPFGEFEKNVFGGKNPNLLVNFF